MRTAQEFFQQVVRTRLSAEECLELGDILDEGGADELWDLCRSANKEDFPELFGRGDLYRDGIILGPYFQIGSRNEK